MKKKITVEISHKTIIFTALFILGIYLFFLLKDLIMGIFISTLIATALNPAVNYLEKLRIPRAAAIIGMYTIIITLVVVSVGTIVPPLITQTQYLVNSLPLENFTSELKLLEVNLENLDLVVKQIGSVAPVFRIVSTTFSGFITLFTFSVITFYILMERKNLHKHLAVLFGDEGQESKAEKFVNKVEQRIGGWVRGEMALMFIVGFTTYVGLRLLNVPLALPLSIIAGLLELIPNIGPTVSAIPAIISPLLTGQKPIMAVFVAALYIIVQQLENNLFVPRIMKSATGVHPILTILLIIVGLKLFGLTGAVLAVPIFLVAQVTYQEFIRTKRS